MDDQRAIREVNRQDKVYPPQVLGIARMLMNWDWAVFKTIVNEYIDHGEKGGKVLLRGMMQSRADPSHAAMHAIASMAVAHMCDLVMAQRAFPDTRPTAVAAAGGAGKPRE